MRPSTSRLPRLWNAIHEIEKPTFYTGFTTRQPRNVGSHTWIGTE